MKLSKEQIKKNALLADDVEANWPLKKGKNEYIGYLRGVEITRGQAMVAQCYTCMYGYDGGPEDCQGYSCPMYNYFPYKTKASRKEYTEEERAVFAERMKKANEAKRLKREQNEQGETE